MDETNNDRIDEMIAEFNLAIRNCNVQLNSLDDIALPWRWFVWFSARRAIAYAKSGIRNAEAARRHSERARELDARIKELENRRH